MILSKKRSIYSFLTVRYADFLNWAKSAVQDMDKTGKLLELGGSLKSITYSILRAFWESCIHTGRFGQGIEHC